MEVARLQHNDLGMNTEYFRALHLLCMYSYFLMIFLLVFPHSAVHVDPKTTWYTFEDRDKGVDMTNLPYTIPICALAPTVPRRIVLKTGWNNIHQPKM